MARLMKHLTLKKTKKYSSTTEGPAQHILTKCDEIANLLGSLSHPTRLKVLCCLSSGAKRVSELMEFCELEQPSMSQFLKRMKDDGLLKASREGTSIYYDIADPRLFKLMKNLKDIFCES
jgi:DNA-binding transcriptional ArsR family regulator